MVSLTQDLCLCVGVYAYALWNDADSYIVLITCVDKMEADDVTYIILIAWAES